MRAIEVGRVSHQVHETALHAVVALAATTS